MIVCVCLLCFFFFTCFFFFFFILGVSLYLRFWDCLSLGLNSNAAARLGHCNNTSIPTKCCRHRVNIKLDSYELKNVGSISVTWRPWCFNYSSSNYCSPFDHNMGHTPLWSFTLRFAIQSLLTQFYFSAYCHFCMLTYVVPVIFIHWLTELVIEWRHNFILLSFTLLKPVTCPRQRKAAVFSEPCRWCTWWSLKIYSSTTESLKNL